MLGNSWASTAEAKGADNNIGDMHLRGISLKNKTKDYSLLMPFISCKARCQSMCNKQEEDQSMPHTHDS
jgi:hypothetical protein